MPISPENFYDQSDFSAGDATPDRAPPNTPEQRIADKLFGDTTPSPEAQPRRTPVDKRPFSDLTEDEQANRLYGATDPTLTHADATQAIINSGLEDHLHDPETAGAIAAEWAKTFAEHQLTSTDSKELADIGARVMREAPTPTLVAQWTETAIQNLQVEYGVEGAGQALRDARSYIGMRGDLKNTLDKLGLGSHPKIVAIAAARGRALRQAGKLR
jgi:hypothetical protein